MEIFTVVKFTPIKTLLTVSDQRKLNFWKTYIAQSCEGGMSVAVLCSIPGSVSYSVPLGCFCDLIFFFSSSVCTMVCHKKCHEYILSSCSGTTHVAEETKVWIVRSSLKVNFVDWSILKMINFINQRIMVFFLCSYWFWLVQCFSN